MKERVDLDSEERSCWFVATLQMGKYHSQSHYMIHLLSANLCKETHSILSILSILSDFSFQQHLTSILLS